MSLTQGSCLRGAQAPRNADAGQTAHNGHHRHGRQYEATPSKPQVEAAQLTQEPVHRLAVAAPAPRLVWQIAGSFPHPTKRPVLARRRKSHGDGKVRVSRRLTTDLQPLRDAAAVSERMRTDERCEQVFAPMHPASVCPWAEKCGAVVLHRTTFRLLG